ncbi:MAG TPA: cell division topological specificity factor MinE [Stellaceae bacterium]|nr:cell division topological specificity factor MinE [Stellaceae bacterium]
MSLFDFFFPKKPASASVAKERLQIVLAHERAGRAYDDAVARFVGEQREMRFVMPERRSFLRGWFGRAAS